MTTLQEIAFNRQLATQVRRHSCLYDSVVKYDKREQEDAWLAIVDSFREPNITVDECKRKWQNLRNHYCRATRAGESHYLDAELSFLLPHLKLNLKRKSTSVDPLTNIMLHSIIAMNQSEGANVAPGNNPQSSQNARGAATEEEEGIPSGKRRASDNCEPMKCSDPEDERAMFMHNLIPVLQAMDEEQWKKFRFRVTGIVDDILG